MFYINQSCSGYPQICSSHNPIKPGSRTRVAFRILEFFTVHMSRLRRFTMKP